MEMSIRRTHVNMLVIILNKMVAGITTPSIN